MSDAAVPDLTAVPLADLAALPPHLLAEMLRRVLPGPAASVQVASFQATI